MGIHPVRFVTKGLGRPDSTTEEYLVTLAEPSSGGTLKEMSCPCARRRVGVQSQRLSGNSAQHADMTSA